MSTTPPPAATTTAQDASGKPDRNASATRMPSLNQLAARIKLDAPTPANAANRPRLAAALLRTSSNTSSAAASTSDSTIVNPPITRAESPAQLPISPPRSNGSTPSGEKGDPLTTEMVEKLNQETAAPPPAKEDKPRQKMPVGYKNIPSLDAITARLAKARTLSIDGSAKPPEAETIEDPKTPGLMIKAPEHPLEHSWCVLHCHGGDPAGLVHGVYKFAHLSDERSDCCTPVTSQFSRVVDMQSACNAISCNMRLYFVSRQRIGWIQAASVFFL